MFLLTSFRGSVLADVEFVKVHEDVRGRIFKAIINDFEFYLLETRKGYARGGHSHTVDSYIVVLRGRLEYRAMVGGREIVRTVGEGDVIFTEKDDDFDGFGGFCDDSVA